MPKIKIKWNSERLLSFSAMSISFITLIIFIYQTNLMSKQNYLSIMPYLDFSQTRDFENHVYEVKLENHGIGPAIIESATIVYQNKRHNLSDYNNELYTFLRSMVPALDSLQNVSSSTLDKGMAIPANTEYTILSVKGPPEDYQLIQEGIKKLIEEGMDYEIVYKSIQDEHWLIHNNSEGPKKLD
ncbi:MAG: hypothetical protein DHS20C18_21600 [Saprospiraceae bacterium]|nr:MAG: hypothetical protein DHS20C18_21600 [Saprospiraceae bacterium]